MKGTPQKAAPAPSSGQDGCLELLDQRRMIDHGRRDRVKRAVELLPAVAVVQGGVRRIDVQPHAAEAEGLAAAEAEEVVRRQLQQPEQRPSSTRDRFVTCRSNEKLAPSLTQPWIERFWLSRCSWPSSRGRRYSWYWPLSACWVRSVIGSRQWPSGSPAWCGYTFPTAQPFVVLIAGFLLRDAVRLCLAQRRDCQHRTAFVAPSVGQGSPAAGRRQ